MTPVIYKPKETDFSHNGLGFLSQALKCEVKEERNGKYELELEYPAQTRFSDFFENGYQIKAKPNDQEDYHIFRIYDKLVDAIMDTVTIYGQSRTYDLGNREVQHVEIKSMSGNGAMKAIEAGMDQSSDVELYSDIDTVSSTTFEARNVLNCIAGEQGSLLQYWGGEIKREPFKLSLLERRGRDRLGTVRYGKDLQGLKIRFNWSNIITKVLPYADVQNPDDGQTKRIYGNAVLSSLVSNYPDVYAHHIQFTEDQGVTDLASLNRVAEKYFTSLNPDSDKPSVSIDLQIEKLTDSEEAKEFAKLKNYGLCDTFTVYHKKYDIEIEAKIISVVYDSLLEKNKDIKAGDAQPTFYQKQNNDFQAVLKTLSEKSYMSDFVDYITGLINGVQGGSVYQYPKNKPNTHYFLDTDSIETAKDVIAINNQGIGFSRTGWKGPFTNAWSIDGILNADFIQAGTLRAIDIIGCFFQTLMDDDSYVMTLSSKGMTFTDQSNDRGQMNLRTSKRDDGYSLILSINLNAGASTLNLSESKATLLHPKEVFLDAPTIKLGSSVEVRDGKLYIGGQQVHPGGSGGGGGGNLGTIENYAKNMITAEFNVDYDKMYSSYQNFGRIKAWGLTSRATFDELNQIIRNNGVSPVFFWAYEGGEGYHPSLSFLNHYYTNGSSYQEECRRTAAWVKETSAKSGSLAWYDAQYPYYTSPADKQALGNAYMAETAPGMIARVMLQGTAAATWAMFDPAALKGSVNGVQDYADPFAHQITLIQSWQKPQAYVPPLDQPITVTSAFGWREDPINGGSQFHSGIDLVNGNNVAPIYAIAAGEVIYSGIASGYGEYIAIQHASGIISGYGHMASGSRTVSVGQSVSAGQRIATIGTTGSSTGIHLDLQMKTSLWPASNDGFMNPADYINF